MVSKTILVIEDDSNLRETLSDILMVNGYEVLTANDGEEGYQTALEMSPDLIICDIKMPNMDGYEVLKLLRDTIEAHQIPPFIFLSANIERNDIRTGMKLGAEDYITKPFTNDEIISAIHSRLNIRDNYKNSILNNERELLATELHNNLQQLLSATQLNLNHLSKKESIRKDDKIMIIKTREFIEMAIQESRNLAHRLFPSEIELHGIEKFLSSLKKQLCIKDYLNFKYQNRINRRCSIELELFLCRSIQELVGNVIKHANAHNINLVVENSNDNKFIICTVNDDGNGFEMNEKINGKGIEMIRQKISKLGGYFTITSDSINGTHCRLKVPY